ncbi:MAG: glyoxalase [Cryomorphaceae bacterium]
MTSERDMQLRAIRPGLELQTEKSCETEKFQSETLRPILKFQNGIILAQFKKYIEKFKPQFNAYNQSAQKNYIEDAMKKDVRIKNSLIACTVSMMTLEEYEFYCANKNELNKRIVAMVIERIKDQVVMLY